MPIKDLKTTPLTDWAANELKKAINMKNEAPINTETNKLTTCLYKGFKGTPKYKKVSYEGNLPKKLSHSESKKVKREQTWATESDIKQN